MAGSNAGNPVGPARSAPVSPSFTFTAGVPLWPGAATTSAFPSPSASSAATRTPTVNALPYPGHAPGCPGRAVRGGGGGSVEDGRRPGPGRARAGPRGVGPADRVGAGGIGEGEVVPALPLPWRVCPGLDPAGTQGVGGTDEPAGG